MSVWLTYAYPAHMEQTEFNVEVGRLVRRERDRARLTQEDLADAVDLGRTSITNIEQGNQTVTLWLALRLAAALNCPLTALIPSGETASLPSDMPPRTTALLERLAVGNR